MVATLDYVERKFNEFNHTIFGGRLKPLPFRLSNARTFLGQLRYSRKRSFWGGWKYGNFQFVISAGKEMDERLLEDTIIHEMIHYHILSNQLQDTSAHGKLFRKIMDDINARFGRNVTISHKPTEEEREKDREIRRHLICTSRFADGRTGITIAARTRVFMLWNEIPKFPGVVECKWYSSLNPYFNRFRRSQTVKIYLVDREELERQLADALPLVKEGGTIKTIPLLPHP